jgi:hypothetical protein
VLLVFLAVFNVIFEGYIISALRAFGVVVWADLATSTFIPLHLHIVIKYALSVIHTYKMLPHTLTYT